MEPPFLFVVGFMFGILLWNVCLRVVVSLVSLVLRRDAYDIKLTYPIDNGQRRILAVVALAAAIWISGVGSWSYRVHGGSADWAAVLAGIAAGPLVAVLVTIVAIRRLRKRAASNG